MDILNNLFSIKIPIKYILLGERRVYFLISNLILMDRGNATKVWFQNMNIQFK